MYENKKNSADVTKHDSEAKKRGRKSKNKKLNQIYLVAIAIIVETNEWKCAAMNSKICFQLTVQSLARILAQIKPTPWEKVNKICFFFILRRFSSVPMWTSKVTSTNCLFRAELFVCLLCDACRCWRCFDIVHKKMLLAFSVWIHELRRPSSRLGYTSWKVDVNTNRILYHIYCDWPNRCRRLSGSTMANPIRQIVCFHTLIKLKKIPIYFPIWLSLRRYPVSGTIQFLFEHIAVGCCGQLSGGARRNHCEPSGNAEHTHEHDKNVSRE